MSWPNNQSIIGKALFKGTLMALTNACIIWLILYIANMDKSVLMVVAVVVAAAFGYVTAYLEARAARTLKKLRHGTPAVATSAAPRLTA